MYKWPLALINKALTAILLIAFQALTGVVQADTFIVGTCESGTQKATVALALTAATASGNPHTIRICPGTYTEAAALLVNNSKQDSLLLLSTSGNAADVVISTSASWVDTLTISRPSPG